MRNTVLEIWFTQNKHNHMLFFVNNDDVNVWKMEKIATTAQFYPYLWKMVCT